MDNFVTEKRKRISLSKEEREILISFFVKAIIPIIIIIVVSSIVLFFGFHFLIKKTGFSNYGLSPVNTVQSVSKFISTYIIIATTNILLMITLSIIVLYLVLHNTVLPVMRITRILRKHFDAHERRKISVRSSDKLFIPLVDMVNRLLSDKQ
ncbi:MAG: hypothetical protein JW871_06470 [Endomicrobiales bacterium]|nr:hypothetical protein [Endomicrobiales bacterium]